MEDKFYAHAMEKKDGDWVVYGENYSSTTYLYFCQRWAVRK